MADIFVSYSHADRPTLDQLILQMRNVVPDSSVWFDEHITGGKDWWHMILEEIRKCRLFLYLISDDAAESEHCQNELECALKHNKTILPVIIRRLRSEYPGNMPDDLTDNLRKLQYIDLSSGLDGNATSKLWGAMTQKLFSSSTESASPAPPDDRHITLSRKERWFLANQFAILAKLYPNETDTYENMREIVENGYELNYDWISEHIYHSRDIMTRENCLEVLNILDMFSAVQSAYEGISDKSGIDDIWISFVGFDGNNETTYMAYTRFLVEQEGKFTWIFPEEQDYDRFNSHHPVLHRYRAMLQEWQKSPDHHNLTKDDLIRITSVEVHYATSR